MLVPVLSVFFGLLALFALGQIVSSLRARLVVPDLVPFEDMARAEGSLLHMARTNALIGAFFALGAVVVWWSAPLGLVIGGFPLLAFALLFVTGNVDVISHLSKEE